MCKETFAQELEAFAGLSREEKAEILALMKEILSKRDAALPCSDGQTVPVSEQQ